MSGRSPRLLGSERGSITVEAVLVFPMIVMLTLVCLLLSLTSCRSALVAVGASLTADRASYVWDNSAKNIATGAFPPERRDPLYARSVVDDLTALLGDADPADAVWSIGDRSQQSSSGSLLAERKLAAAASWMPSDFRGTLVYRNRLFISEIRVRLSSRLRFALPLGGWASPTDIEWNAYVAEPDDLMRNVDLVVSFASRIRDYLQRKPEETTGPGGSGKDTDSTTTEYVPISSEAEAKAYIRKLVHGGGAQFDTVIDHYREIDAIDPDGVAHEAKYTVNEADAKRQIAKDRELMQKGLIKGAVWHFFPYRKTGRVQLTEALRDLLAQNGIVVIVHQD